MHRLLITFACLGVLGTSCCPGCSSGRAEAAQRKATAPVSSPPGAPRLVTTKLRVQGMT